MFTPDQKFKKGDEVYIVSVSSSNGSCGWNPTSESFRSVVWAEKATLTSLGAKQGTAVTVKGNLLRRIYAGAEYATKLVRTEAEVRAIADAIGLQPAVDSIARETARNDEWIRDYSPGGRFGTGRPLGLERAATLKAALPSCVALPPLVVFR